LQFGSNVEHLQGDESSELRLLLGNGALEAHKVLDSLDLDVLPVRPGEGGKRDAEALLFLDTGLGYAKKWYYFFVACLFWVKACILILFDGEDDMLLCHPIRPIFLRYHIFSLMKQY
jgi:hypothetical protein